MFSPAIPNVMEELHVKTAVLGSFSVSMFILGYAIGPLSASQKSTANGIDSLLHYQSCMVEHLLFTLAMSSSQYSKLAVLNPIRSQH